MNKAKIICNGCGKVKDEIDIWDKNNTLCDKCSMKNANPQTINNSNKLTLSYIN